MPTQDAKYGTQAAAASPPAGSLAAFTGKKTSHTYIHKPGASNAPQTEARHARQRAGTLAAFTRKKLFDPESISRYSE